MNIIIDKEINELTPDFSIGVIEADVVVSNTTKLDILICAIEENIKEKVDIKEVVLLDTILDARKAYKAYGKDPSRYRLAVESLYRRLAKGNKLYRVNNLVDLGNIISIRTRKSVAVLDYDKICGQDILIRLGRLEDEYFGIGRGKLNINRIPLYEDSVGPFGSTTSDTERTMITNDTKKILLFIISFNGKSKFEAEIEETIELYKEYGNATNIISYIV
jgi:DNA/RNA-binding domain of Phe-tRNA-synthetase-like protein